MSSEESFHNCFFYFIKTLRLLVLDASEQCDIMGNYLVSGEIKLDVLNDGVALIGFSGDYLLSKEKNIIDALVNLVKELPEDALLRYEHKKAMMHPAWNEVRILASQAIKGLKDAIERNEKFFNG